MASAWPMKSETTQRGNQVGGPVLLTWDHTGAIVLERAGSQKSDLVFEPDDLESLWATIQDAGLNADPAFVRLYGTERWGNGAEAHKALAGDIVRPRVDGAGNRKDNGYSAKMLAKFEHVALQLRLMNGKPSLWVYQEEPIKSRSGGNAKPKPALEIKRVSIGGNVKDEPRSATPRGPQINRSNRRRD